MAEIKELIDRISGDDESAFNELFALYWGRLYNYALSFTKSKETAIESTQDVFIKIWLKRNLLTEVSNFDGYVFSMARNNILDAVKSNLKMVIEKEPAEDFAIDEIYHPDTQLAVKDLQSRLAYVIESLPPVRKKVFKLHRIDGKTYDEIAEDLSISKNTVKDHIKHSLKYIRMVLNDEKLPLLIIAILLKKF